MTSFDFRPGINEEESFSATTESGFDFRPGVQLPAAASDAAGVPPSPEEALPVDPVVPVASGGRNNARVAPEPTVAADEPFDIDAQIARNNEFAARVDDVLANTPSPSGRNDTTKRASAPPVGQDGVNPVSVFNPAPLTDDQIREIELSRVQNVMAQPGPTRDKANLNVNPTISGVQGVPGNYTMDIMGSAVPVDDETAAKSIARGNTYQIPNNAFMRGLSRANQSMALLGANLGLMDQSEAIKVITELNRITPDQPPELQAALQEIVDADGWLESLQAIANNPGAVMSVIAESLPMSAASLTVFMTGSAVGTPLTGSALAGLVTYGQIYNDVILSELREAGVDMNNNAAVQQMLSDPEFYARARDRAGTYALPIAVFDALSMGLAGKIAGAAIKSGAPTSRIAAAAGTDTFLQMGFGSAGEATAQLLELEKGFRDKISKGEILLEGVAEGPIGAIEVATGTASGAQQARANREAAEIQALEEQAAVQAAIALQSSDNAQMALVPDGETAFDFRPGVEPAPVSAAAPSTDVAPPTTPEPAADPTPEPVAAPAVEPEPTPDPATVLGRLAAEPDPEPAPAAEPAPAPAAEPDNPQDKPELPFALKTDQSKKGKIFNSVTTPDGEKTIKVSVRIVDMADLKSAQGDLQPRDRSLDESAIEIQRRAAILAPGMLMPNNTTDIGAPIMARDGTIISGNGRVASIRLAYEQYPERAAAYRAEVETYLNRADNPSGLGYEMPVLVSMIDQDMTYQELVELADKSNRQSIAAMSATERAQRDAKAMDIEMVNLFQGGSMTSIENQGFVMQFMRSVVAPTEQNQMSRDGQLTKEGVQRMQNAILASAYEDTDALAIMLDSTDDNIKAISNAMLDAAPSFAKLKSDIAAGEVPSQFDISSKVTEAARKISDLRNRGIKPRDFFAQQDAFSEIDPDVEALIRAFYNDELTRAKSQRIMSDVLKNYTEEAAQKKEGGFFEDTTTPRDVIELARRKADGTEGQGDLLADAEQRPSRSLNESGEQTQRATPTRSREESGSKRSREATEARRQRQAKLRDDAERPSRAEVASEETLGATEDTVVTISELDALQTQKPGTLVYRESMREGSALYMQAFEDLGLDYNRATSLPIENQFRMLADAMVKKFGFAAVVKTDNANAKEAVDQLLVGYHNMNDMAYRLQLPPQAMGLDGTLSFVLANKKNYFGQYNPNNRSITLPKRSNSFAHEWFHALDHYLLEKYGSGVSTELPLVSSTIRAHGTEAFGPNAPTGVKDSYFALMRALFKDKATEAMQLKAINQKMSEMEARAAKAGKAVSQIKSYQNLQKQKDNILAGIGKSKRVLKTDYRTNSEFFNALEGRKSEYYGTPAEMAARAFEAFAIRQLVNEGLDTAGMGKSQAAYDMTLEQLGVTKEELADGLAGYAAKSDSRLALTFPKGQEQVEIFGAFTNLMDALRLETALGEGDVASPTSRENIIDRRAMLNVPEREKGSFIAEQKKAKREAQLETARIEKRIDQYGNRYKGFKKAVVMVEDAVLSPALYQKQTTIRSLIKRYPANTALRRIYENLGTHTGGVYQTTVEGDNLANAEARQIRFFSAMLKGIFEKYDIKSMDDAELNMLRQVLTGQDDLGGAPDRVVKAAGDIRDMYNQLYDYMNSAGMDIGYARSGYIPRMLDLPNVFADEAKFLSKADEVYRIVWDEELGDAPNFNSADMMFDTIKFIQTAKLSISELNIDGERKSLGNSETYRGFVDSELWQEVRDADKALKALLRKKDSDPSAVKDSEIDDARRDLQEAVDRVAPQFERFFGKMRTMFADYRARNWLESIQDNQSVDPASSSPQAVFSKKRALPPEADTLLEDFYYQNPIDSLTSYMMAAVRKAEYNRRFGKQNMPKVANKTKYNDYLDYLIDKSAADSANGGYPDGVRISTAEVKMLRLTVDNILGRNDAMQPSMGVKAVNRATALLSMTLLIRAPISSIAEPFTVAMSSGSVVKGLHSFGLTMQELPGLRKLGKNAAEDIRLRHQFARIMGVIDDPSVSDIIMSRIGGEFNGDENLQRFLSSFFQKIQLTGITNAQRRTAARIGFQFMTEMAYEIRNPSSARNAKRAQLTLNDLGVADSRMDQFVDYLLGLNNMTEKGRVDGKIHLPTIDQVTDENATYTDMGLQLAVSVMRFTDQSIQDPRRADRPRWAENPVGKFVYGITSFIRSFHDKVLMGSIRKVQREARISRELGASKSRARADATAYAAVKVAGPMLTFFAAHALVATAREYLLNQDRWDREWEESDEDAVKFVRGYLFENAFSRSGLTGAFDPLYQAWTGIKYQRDLSNILIGTAGYVTQEFDNLMGVFGDKNSPNTVSAEFKAYRAIWNLIAQPTISYTFAKTPMADVVKIPAYGLAAAATSTTVKNYLINELVHLIHGQRYEPGQRGRTSGRQTREQRRASREKRRER